jgi:hypothetical protein
MSLRIHEPSGLPMHDDGQQWRVLGCLKSNGFSAFPRFGDTFPVLPESEWEEGAIDISSIPVFNQGQAGSCTGHGSVTAFTFSWWLSGQGVHAFSPTSVYARINGGKDQGAMVHDAVAALRQYGTCFMSQFGESQLFEQQLSADAVQTAARFRVNEAYKIGSWQEMGSALTKGLMVVSGLAVGNNFSNLDQNGVCPVPDRVIGGHCLAHYGLKKVGGMWVAATRNSWGPNWGHGGNCYIQQGIYNPQYGFPFDAFAIGGVLDDPQETNTDPPAFVI